MISSLAISYTDRVEYIQINTSKDNSVHIGSASEGTISKIYSFDNEEHSFYGLVGTSRSSNIYSLGIIRYDVDCLENFKQ